MMDFVVLMGGDCELCAHELKISTQAKSDGCMLPAATTLPRRSAPTTSTGKPIRKPPWRGHGTPEAVTSQVS